MRVKIKEPNGRICVRSVAQAVLANYGSTIFIEFDVATFGTSANMIYEFKTRERAEEVINSLYTVGYADLTN